MSEIKPNEGQLSIIDAEGNERLCQILFTINSEEFNKNYVVFFPIEALNEEDDDEQIELMAASYTENEDGNGELHEIETDEEWSFIEDAIADYEQQMEEHGCHCGCDHDHGCDADCDCDCEEDCESEGHCCCHHDE